MKTILIAVLALAMNASFAQTLLPSATNATITENGSYYSTSAADQVTISSGVIVNVSSGRLSANDFILQSGASITINSGAELNADGWGWFAVLGTSSGLTSITAKDDGAFVGNDTSIENVHRFRNVTLHDTAIYSDRKSVVWNDVTLSGQNASFGGHVQVKADRLTLDLGTYSAPINYTLFDGGTVTLQESLILDLDFGGADAIDNVSITLNSLVLDAGVDASDISFAGYSIAEGGFVNDGANGFVFQGKLVVIPEPSSAMLSVLSLAGLMLRRRRKVA